MRLDEIARVIRSKNAGPRTQTFDIMFGSEADYARASGAIASLRQQIATRYGVPENSFTVIDYPPAMAIKVVMPRRMMAGNVGDTDVYGAQQHSPLLGVEL